MQYPAFQNLIAGELLIKVRKHISAGKYDLKRREELFIEWEALQSGVDVGEEAYGVTAKAASRRAKIRSALCSWNLSPNCICKHWMKSWLEILSLTASA